MKKHTHQRRIIALILITSLLFPNFHVNSVQASADEKRKTFDIVEKVAGLEACVKNAVSLNEILLNDNELLEFLHTENAAETLYTIRENTNQNTKGSLINILINYIESDYSVTDLAVLSSYVTIYITTISGKRFPIKRFSDNENENNNYNCHAFAWYYGCSYNSNDRVWLDDPSSYYWTIHGTCYSSVFSNTIYPSTVNASMLQAGDIVIYIAYSDEVMALPNNTDGVVHSATVVSVNGNNVTVISKNGVGSVTTHNLAGGGYYLALDGPHAGEEREIQVYRPSHSIDTSWLANKNYKYKDENQHYYACPYCARYTAGVEYHNFVTHGAVTRCTDCGHRPQIINSYMEEN